MGNFDNGPSSFWYNQIQRELDRRFNDMQDQMNRRFTDIDKDNDEIKKRIIILEGAPRDSFRIYIVPILTAIVTALILSFLVRQGVVTK